MRISTALCLCALFAWAVPTLAQWREWDADFDEDKKSWKELEARIPPYPKPENLIRLQTGAATPHQFFIDANSVTLGEDGVMRYTMMVKTSGGATNVTFEGMRCETRQHKIYAVGHSDSTWIRARDPKWQPIVLRDLTPQHHTLYYDYFCPERVRATPPKQALEALKRGPGFAHTRIQ